MPGKKNNSKINIFAVADKEMVSDQSAQSVELKKPISALHKWQQHN